MKKTIDFASIEEWQEFYNVTTSKTLYSSYDWHKLFHDHFEYKASPLKITFDTGQKAILPLSIHKSWKKSCPVAVSSPVGTYGGLLGQNDRSISLDLCYEIKQFIGDSYSMEITGSPTLCQEQKTNLYTEVFDFNKGENIKIKLNQVRGLRNKLNKANKLNLELVLLSSLDTENFFSMYTKKCSEWGSNPSYSLSFFSDLINLKGVNLWGVKYDDDVVLFSITVESDSYLSVWKTISLSKNKNIPSHDFYFYNQVLNSQKRGLRYFDFNPSNNIKGVENYKAKFGASKKYIFSYKHYTFKYKMLEKVGTSLYSQFK